jgi:DNA-binding NarL/FixJ family response regulator
MSKITVLLVDDHALVRVGFRRMLEDEEDIQVIGEASDGSEAVDRAAELKPQVVVIDFALPSMNGATATHNILKANPQRRTTCGLVWKQGLAGICLRTRWTWN